MGAVHNLQLQMFAPAGKITAALASGRLDSGDLQPENFKQVKRMKIREARSGGEMNSHGGTRRGGDQTLADSIRTKGIVNPIEVQHTYGDPPAMWDGHHRVFMADHVDPTTEVPISHSGGQWYARQQRQSQGGHA